MRRWKTIVKERYRVLSEIGLEGLEQLVFQFKTNQKKYGHCNYAQGVIDFHLEWFKNNEKIRNKIIKLEALKL